MTLVIKRGETQRYIGLGDAHRIILGDDDAVTTGTLAFANFLNLDPKTNPQNVEKLRIRTLELAGRGERHGGIVKLVTWKIELDRATRWHDALGNYEVVRVGKVKRFDLVPKKRGQTERKIEGRTIIVT